MNIASAVILCTIVGAVGAIILVAAAKFMAVEEDPRIEEVASCLAGANCGGCGYAGCADYAKAVVMDGVPCDKCAPGGPKAAAAIAKIMGGEASAVEKKAVVQCQGSSEHCKPAYDYKGIQTCAAAATLYGGPKTCSFACIGLASMIFVQIGYFMPILWIMMMVFTLSFSVKTFFASLVGLIVPYWFAAGYFFYTDNIQGLADHFCEFINYSELFDYSQVTDHQVLNLSFVTLLTIIGSIHFIRTSYGDKIRTRMIYETFIMISVACIIFIVLQPQHIQELGGILIVNTAPLIAHFITFTRGKFTNITFILLLIMLVLIMAYNILVPESILL